MSAPDTPVSAPRNRKRREQQRVMMLTSEIMDELGWFSDVDRDRALKLARRINVAVTNETVPPCATCGGRTVVFANPGDNEPAGLCPDCEDGTEPLSTEAIALALAKAVAGPWSESLDSCDCGGDYGCGHGSYLHAIHLPDVPSYTLPDESKAMPGSWHMRCEHSELATMPTDTARFMARSREYVETLLHRLGTTDAAWAQELDDTAEYAGGFTESERNGLRAAARMMRDGDVRARVHSTIGGDS